jgi:hypothetical protein
MNIFGKTHILLCLAAAMLASCSSSLGTPTLSQADKLETAIATVSTVFAETQPALPTPSPSPSRAPSKIGGYWQFSISSIGSPTEIELY